MLFTPAEIDGRPAPLRIRYVMRFRPPPPLDAGAPDAGARDGGGGSPDAGATDASRAEAAPVDAGIAAVDAPPLPARLLRGQVRERGTREPVIGAEVLAVPLDEGG